MAKLSEKEQKMLDDLKAKQEAPDAPSIGRAINVSIDLSDEKQVQRAIRWGLLDPEDTDDGDGDGDDGDEGEDTPKRRGYFDDK